MKKYLALCVALISSQMIMAQQPVMMKYIPENASLVVNFNPIQIANKVPGEHFRQSPMYKEMMKDGDEGSPKMFFTDPSVSGIDFTGNIWVVSTKEGFEPGKPGLNIYGVLKDGDLFRKTVEKLFKGEEIKQYGTDKVMLTKSGSALAWNNQVFVMITPGKKKPRMDEIEEDTAYNESVEITEAKLAVAQEKRMKALRNYCFELLTPKASHRINSSVVFRKAMTNEGDIRLWSDGGPKEALKKINPMAKEISKLTELSGKEVSTVINFENGQISANVHNYPNEDALALYKKHPHPAAPVELLKKLPQQPLMGLFAASFNTELTKELLKQAGMEKLMDSLHQKVPMLDKLKGAFSGGIMLAVLKSDKPAQENQKLKGVDIILAIPILDRSKVEGLKTELNKLIVAEKEEGGKSKILDGLKPAVRINDKVLVLASSESVAQAYIDNDGTAAIPAWVPGNASPLLADINFGTVINAVLGAAGKGGKSAQMEKIFGQFDHITFSGGRLVDDHLENKLSFGFTNKQDNAMVQIFDLVNQFLLESGKKKE